MSASRGRRRSGETRTASALRRPRVVSATVLANILRGSSGRVGSTDKNAKGAAIDPADACFDEVMMYDEFGPGFVGQYNDDLAGAVGSLTPVFQVRTPEGWVYLNSLTASEFLGGGNADAGEKIAKNLMIDLFNTVDEVPGQLLFKMTRYSQTTGGSVLARVTLLDGSQEWWAFPLRYPSRRGGASGSSAIPMYEVSKDPDGSVTGITVFATDRCLRQHLAIGDGSVFWLVNEHPLSDSSTYSEWIRALPHVREFVNAMLRTGADVETGLNESMLFFQTPENGEGEHGTWGDPDGLPGSGDEVGDGGNLRSIIESYVRAMDVGESGRYHVPRKGFVTRPLPMDYDADNPPKLIDVARQLDSSMFQLVQQSLENVARSIGVPATLFLEGPGNAKYDNEGYLFSAWIHGCVKEAATRVFTWVNEVIVKEQVSEVVASAQSGLDNRLEVRAWYRLDELMPRPSFKVLTDVVRWGGASAQEMAIRAGLPVMQTPEGVTPWDVWQIAIQGGTGDPGSGVDRRVNDADGKNSVAIDPPSAE